MALPPESRILWAVSSPASVAISVITTLAPSRANSSAAAWPMPPAEPVIIATLSCNLMWFVSPLKISYQVKIPERQTFAQHWFTTYHVAGNAFANIIGQLAGERTRQFAGSVLEFCC